MTNKKVMLITGGSDGLGKAIAKRFSGKHQVVILSPSEKKLERASKEIGCDFTVADVTDYDQVDNAVRQVVDKYGRIDVLVNNAGLWIWGKLESNHPNLIREVIEVNTLGVIFMARSIVPIMKKQTSGTIINVSSQAGLYGKAERSVYNASKWAVTGFTKCLQAELSKYNIKVVGLYPALMKTGMFKRVGDEKDISWGLEVDEVSGWVERILNTRKDTMILELGMKNIKY